MGMYDLCGGWSADAELRGVFCFILSLPFLLAFAVGGLGFEFCVFVSVWRHALRSEWPFISMIITYRTFRVWGETWGKHSSLPW